MSLTTNHLSAETKKYLRVGSKSASLGNHRWSKWGLRATQPLIAGLLLALLTACHPPPPPPLTLGLNTWVGYDPLVLAREKKLIDPKLVKVVELSSGSETLRHFRNGLLDAAAMTLDEALRLADDGIKVRVIAVLDRSNGADLVMAEPGIDQLAELKGTTIAVESSTVGTLVLQRLLKEAHLQRSDVTVLNMEAPQHLAALKSHRANAAVTYEPIARKLAAAGYHAIFDSSQMPGEIVDVLVVREKAAIDHPDQVDELLNGWTKGMEAVRADPPSAAALLSLGVELSPSAYEAALNSLTFYTPDESLALLSGTPTELSKNADRLMLTLLEMKLLREEPDWNQLLDAGPAKRAKQRRGQQ